MEEAMGKIRRAGNGTARHRALNLSGGKVQRELDKAVENKKKP
jgi:hypothetical protein